VDDRKQPPIALMMLPLVALAGLVAFQYFAPPKAQTEEPAAEQAAGQTPAQAPELSKDTGGTALSGERTAGTALSGERTAGMQHRPSGGVGGSSGGVKCLHAHYADFAAGNDNPIGRDLHDVIGEPRCHAPCVAIVDGKLERNPDWREPTNDSDSR